MRTNRTPHGQSSFRTRPARVAGNGAVSFFLALILLLPSGCRRNESAELARGRALLEEGRPAEAVAPLESACRRLPDSAEPAVLLGRALRDSGDFDRAEAAFREAVKRDPSSADAWRGLADTLVDLGRLEEAAEAYGEVVALDGADTAALLARGRCLAALGRTKEASRSLLAVIQRGDPSLGGAASLVLADMALASGEPVEAERRLLGALALDDSLAVAHLKLARLYDGRLRNPPRALEHYRAFLPAARDEVLRAAVEGAIARLERETGGTTAAAASPTTTTSKPPAPTPEQRIIARANAALEAGNNAEAAGLFQALAQRYLLRGDRESAYAALGKAADLVPDDPAPLRQLAELREKDGDSRAALAAWKQVVDRSPNDLAALMQAANLAMELGENDAAAIYLRRITELSPDSAQPLLLLAQIYDRKLGMRDEARRAYVTFLVQHPKHPQNVAVRARLVELVREDSKPGEPWPWPVPELPGAGTSAPAKSEALARFRDAFEKQRRGNLDEAMALYREAIRLDPQMARAFYNLAICHRQREENPEAIGCYLAAIRIRPAYVDARHNIALLLEKMGDLQGAILQWSKILESDPRDATAHVALGDIYRRDPATIDKARYHYEWFVKLDPQNPLARDVRRWLQINAGGSRRSP